MGRGRVALSAAGSLSGIGESVSDGSDPPRSIGTMRPIELSAVASAATGVSSEPLGDEAA